MVGGSGMYVEAVVRDYRIADVPRNPELRARFENDSIQDLVETLERESPELAARTDVSNRRRVIRALEISDYGRHTKVRFSEPPGVALKFTVFGMKIDRVELRARIRKRLFERLGEGLVEEVRGLLARGLPRRRLDDLGLEYREVAAYLSGEKTHGDMVADLESSICRFAKRQETWFRGMGRRGVPIRWIEPQDADSVVTACGDGAPS
jgi:tRNA dimethylallyltransferase